MLISNVRKYVQTYNLADSYHDRASTCDWRPSCWNCFNPTFICPTRDLEKSTVVTPVCSKGVRNLPIWNATVCAVTHDFDGVPTERSRCIWAAPICAVLTSKVAVHPEYCLE